MRLSKAVVLVGIFFLISLLLTSCVSSRRVGQRQAVQPQRSMIDPQKVSEQINQEKSSYNKEYMLGAIDVIGKCDTFLNTPKFQMHAVSSEIKTSYQKLKINFPQYSDSKLNFYLAETVSKISTVSDNAKYVDSQDAKPRNQRDYEGALSKLDEIGFLLPEIKSLISGINSGL